MTFNYVPTNCPSCNSKLEWIGRDLCCTNNECSSKSYNNLYHWICVVGLKDLKGAGNSLIESLIDYSSWIDVEGIYTHVLSNVDDIIELEDGIGYSKLELINSIISNLYSPIDFTRFLVALNIKNISWNIAESLNKDSNLEECIINDDKGNLNILDIKGIGYSVLNSIISSWSRIRTIYNMTSHANNNDKVSTMYSNDYNRIKICITGKANDGLTRDQFYDKYSKYIEESNVNNCDFLVCNKESNSSKIKTAKSKGVKIITEIELQRIIENTYKNKE